MNSPLTNHELIKELKSIKYFIEFYDTWDEPRKYDPEYHIIDYNPDFQVFKNNLHEHLNQVLNLDFRYDDYYIDKIDDNKKLISVLLQIYESDEWDWSDPEPEDDDDQS